MSNLVMVRKPSSLLTGLLAYWPMSEASGSRAQSVTSGPGALAVVGTGVGAAAGKLYANAADWPSGGTEADYLQLAHADKAGLSTSVGAEVSRTYAWWMYMYDGSTTAGQYHSIWINSGNQFEGGGGESIRINQEEKVWSVWGDGAGHVTSNCHGPAAVLNSWELWIAQQDADANQITIYKIPTSGIEEQDETQAWTYGQQANAIPIDLCSPNTNGNAEHRIGPFMAWSRVLTAGERAALWNGGAGRAYPF